MTINSYSDPKRKPTLQHWIEFSLFKVIAFLSSHGAPRIVDGFSAALWCWIAPRMRRHRRADRNLAIAMPELSEDERRIILGKMWDNLGRTMTEAFALVQIADDPNSIIYNFSDDVIAIMKSDHPAIFVGLHSGNWEIPAIAAESFGKPLTGIYQKIINPLIDKEVLRLRSRFFKGGLNAKAREAVSRIRRGISDGYSIAIMADLRDSNGEFVPFFGLRARTTIFPALLARFYKMPIISIRAVRVGIRRFRVDAVLINLASGPDRKEIIRENTARIQQQFEMWIREDPSQWMWAHNRWDHHNFKSKK